MKGKNVMSVSVLFIIMTVFVVLSIKFGSNMNTDANSLMETLYDKIMSHDLENDYPDSPQGVMDIYCDTLHYLYGGKANSIKIMDIVLVQRKLYSEELLNINPDPDMQYTKINRTVDLNKQHKFSIISVAKENPVFYDPEDLTRCSIRVTQFSNAKSEGNVNIVEDFYLAKNINNQWKIMGWENVE